MVEVMPSSMPRRARFLGRTAIITGGASGIGRALGEALAREGAAVLLADRQAALAEEVAEGIRRAGGDAEAATLDVRDAAAVEALVASWTARRGRLDLLFNNAGIGISGEARAFSQADWDRIVDVNLRGVIHGTRAAFARMAEQGGGHIVNVASMAGLAPTPLVSAYSMTKHGVVGLSLSLRSEGADLGVKVSVACPGPVETPIYASGEHRGMSRAAVFDALVGGVKFQSADACARAILDGVARNQAVIITPRSAALAWWIFRLSPSLWERLTRVIVTRGRAHAMTKP